MLILFRLHAGISNLTNLSPRQMSNVVTNCSALGKCQTLSLTVQPLANVKRCH